MANVGSGAAGRTLIGAGNGASPTFAPIGTNSGLTAHGVLIAEGAGAFVATAAGTAGQVLQSGGASANPAYSAARYPSTTTANQLLYSSAANQVAGLPTANNAALITNGSGVPSATAMGASTVLATNSSGTVAPRAFRVNNQVFTSSGTYTPTTGMLYCSVQCLGGGAAGGGAMATGVGEVSVGGGGGAGQYAVAVFSAATIGVNQSVTIGAAGTPNSGATGGNGGTTSFGSLLSAGGGSGGIASGSSSISSTANGGGGGSGGTGQQYGYQGQRGFAGWATPVIGVSGKGADSALGGGGIAVELGPTVGGPATGRGAGGGGSKNLASQPAIDGGAASAGTVIVTEYIIN